MMETKTEKTSLSLKIEPNSEEGFTEIDDIGTCLLCCSGVNSNQKPVKESNDPGLLSNSLSVIFLLKKVLQVPDIQLQNNLQECGNPDQWIILCDQCADLSRKAKELHSQIVKTARQLRITENLILDKVKNSPAAPEGFTHGQSTAHPESPSRTKIWRSTREFITKYNYRNLSDFTNPFVEGDKMALEYLVNRQNAKVSNKPNVKESREMDDYKTNWHEIEDDPDHELDDDWEPLPANKRENRAIRPKRRKKTTPSSETATKVSSKNRLKRNQRNHVKIYGKFKCNFCDKLFFKGGACYDHEREKHASVPGQFHCDICNNRTFNTARYLMLHKRQSHRIKADGTPLLEPKKVQTKTSKICTICGASVKYLKLHARLMHDDTFDSFCHVCGRGFKRSVSLRNHLLRVHKDDPVTLKFMEEGINVWRCEVKGCSAFFMKKEGLDMHVEKIHGNNLGNGEGEQCGEKRFSCQNCGKGFWRRDKLRRHELIHNKNINTKS